MYTIKKIGAMHCVVTSSGIVQFQSLKRANCTDWLKDNENKK